MRLDASVTICYIAQQYLHFISQQQLRVMTSIELGMRNHQWVPAEVIGRISKLRGGQTFKVLRKLLKNKFVVHTGKRCKFLLLWEIDDGYKLTYLGYDYLALQTFLKRGILKDVIAKIGVGKQSDIYKCTTPQGDIVVLKLTRLGRNSFRSIKKNRQYIGTRTNYNWLYLSRLSSIRQFLFMQLLNENNFTTPRPIDTNRHAIVMSLVEGAPLCHIQRIGSQEEIKVLFEKARDMLVKFAENGLIHGDYNQFNLITNDEGTKLTVIDFPQCVSVNHPNADMYFSRDAQCIYKFFDKMVQRQMSQKSQQIKQQGDMNKQQKKWILNVSDYPMPVLGEIEVKKRLDRELKTKGHITLTEEKELEKAYIEVKEQTEQGGEEEQQQQGSEQQGNNSGQQQQASADDEEQQDQPEDNEQQQIDFHPNQMKKMSFEGQLQLQQITSKPNQNSHSPQHFYDKQLQSLMSELNHVNLQSEFNEDVMLQDKQEQEEQEEEEERPQFKGLTAYQIRQKIKQEKRLEREKRKSQMTEDEFIKNAVKRIRRKDNTSQATRMIGNRGNKKKNRMNADNIKFGYEW